MEVITLLRAIGVNKGSQKGALKCKALKQYAVPSAIRFHFRRCEKKTKTLENIIMRDNAKAALQHQKSCSEGND